MSAAANLRKQVADLTFAITQQRQLLTEMEAGLEDLQNQLQSIVYPILTLPPEITAEIFLHCLYDEPEDTIISDVAPLLLTRVCSAWREIAISTPALWQIFAVELDSPQELPNLSQIAQLWLKRAKKCPLSIRICGELVANDTFHIFIKVLRRHSQDIQSLELHLDSEDIETMDSLLPHGLDLALLESLVINVPFDEDDDPAESTALAMFQNSPVLRIVRLSFAYTSFIVLPWQQLSEFRGQAYTVGACLEALRLMPNLLRCAFAAYELNVDEVCEIVVHGCMQHLTLLAEMTDGDEDTLTSSHVLRFLTLPVLQTLIVERTDYFDADEFDLFLNRSSPPLRKLTVRPIDQTMVLHVSPILLTLDLIELELWSCDCAFIPRFFEAFSRHHHKLFPHLQRLAILDCPSSMAIDTGNCSTIVEVLHLAAEPIAKRRDMSTQSAQLQSFRVTSVSGGPILPNDLAPFRILKEDGLDVCIESWSVSYL
ncbi:F-box domain-containing protein [Favolaschia claudopus]|uniref:F-box domain-containing protein n=1 Tax=Favolaschia claudopus TaxID=2862362 RepID=A0AAW0EDF6_9AGAR